MLDKSSKTAGRVLLPDYVTPVQYDLKITPDLKQFTFDGVVSIQMNTAASAGDHKSITLHAKELLFKAARFQVGDTTIEAEEVKHRPMIGKNFIALFCLTLFKF